MSVDRGEERASSHPLVMYELSGKLREISSAFFLPSRRRGNEGIMVRGTEEQEGERTCTYETFKTSRFFTSFLPSHVLNIT